MGFIGIFNANGRDTSQRCGRGLSHRMYRFLRIGRRKLNINGILHYPKMNHVYGSDAMIYHGQDFNTDVTFSLQDIWVLNDVDLQKVKRWCVDKDTLISL